MAGRITFIDLQLEIIETRRSNACVGRAYYWKVK